jgi:proline iminopeptidase
MQILYPDIKPYAQTWLEVGEGHRLYIEQCGDPDGIPVLVVHEGPGLGCDADHRRFFDPSRYRIILADQRGSGRSTPHAELESNTTDDLMADMEAIRQDLNIDQWMLFGGGWGATQALLYAQRYPRRVLGLILRGVFLGRQHDLDWLYREGANLLFPDFWEDFLAPIPDEERHDLIAAYHRRLTGDDEIARMAAAKSWCLWEARISTLHSSHRLIEQLTQPHTALALARIQSHYFLHRCFLDEQGVLREASVLRDIPGLLIHGRYDCVSPLENAVTLLQAWPEANLDIIRDAGHAATEPGITDALIRATRAMARRLERGL